MAEQVIFPQWREENGNNAFPFSSRATLVNAEGRVIVEGAFIDAALYPVGGQAGLFLSKVTISHESMTFYVGDSADRERASGTIALVNGPDNVYLVDKYDRPAGILVSESGRLSVFQAWGVGDHAFEPAESEFAATVCLPTPRVGIRALALETGELFVGDVWLIGDDGVVLRTEEVITPRDCGVDETAVQAIRVDVVGDPLFRRRLCTPPDLFSTPRFIKKIKVVDALGQHFICRPDDFGGVLLVTNNASAVDTTLRITPREDGILIRVVGSPDQAATGL